MHQSDCYQDSPKFSLAMLKAKTIDAYRGSAKEGLCVREMAGGTTKFLFMPLIKLFHTLIIIIFQGNLSNS